MGTTCYRPPELLFGQRKYGCAVDLWAAGCVVAEIVHAISPSMGGRKTDWALFDAGELGSELALVKSIFETLGTPDAETWPVSLTGGVCCCLVASLAILIECSVAGIECVARLEQDVFHQDSSESMGGCSSDCFYRGS